MGNSLMCCGPVTLLPLINHAMVHIYKSLLFISLALLITSCKKEEDKDKNNNNNSQNTAPAPTITELKAAFNGTEWIAKVETIECVFVSVLGSNSITIEGEAEDGSSITISLSLWNNNPGTFEIAEVGFSNYVGMTYRTNNSVSYSAPSQSPNAGGSLVISYWDEQKIRGSFNFVGGQDNSNETVTLTNGTFSILTVN